MSPDRPVITEPGSLRSFITSTEDHFVLAALGIPRLDADTWVLEVTGSVDRELALSYSDLRALPSRASAVTLECAGDPLDLDRPLRRVSTARWRGVSLADVLELAGARSSASHVWLDGADHGVYRSGSPVAELVTEYRKDLPLAVSPDVLLAYEMNGHTLPPEHGFPVRVIVPGHYGTNSVKWLRRITVANGRPQGLFCSVLYHHQDRVDGIVVRRPIREVAVNSVITEPEPGVTLPLGQHRVAGWVWGCREVIGVDVGVGASWHAARLEPMRDRAWQRFESTVTLTRPGEHRILACARDRHGQQPMDEHINQVASVTVRVKVP